MKMLKRLLLAFLLIPAIGYSQQADTLIKKLDSLGLKADTSKVGQINNTNEEAYEGVKLDFKDYFLLLGNDFKQQATLPFRINGKEWLKFGGFALATGVLSLTNKPVNRFAVNLRENNKGVANVSKFITNFGGTYEIYTLAGFFAYGLIFNTQKEKTTTALATQAYLTAGAVQVLTKFISGEQRPNYIDPLTGKNGPIFHGPFYRFKKDAHGNKVDRSAYSSFPSGHTTAAFAAATVYAMEYKNHGLIPILSYSAATLIGLSRLTENKHWSSDIFVGAVLGYLSGRQVVNNYHRFSKIKQPGKPGPKDISFNLQYSSGHIMPGLVYTF